MLCFLYVNNAFYIALFCHYNEIKYQLKLHDYAQIFTIQRLVIHFFVNN